MKWVKLAVGVVIAVIMVGFIVTSLHSVTQGTTKDEVVTFELLVGNELAYDVYEKIYEYAITDNYGSVTNLVSITYNDTMFGEASIYDNDINYYYELAGNNDNLNVIIHRNENYTITSGLEVGDIITITFNVTQAPRVTGVIATLLLLTPLIFTGGALAYMLNKQEF